MRLRLLALPSGGGLGAAVGRQKTFERAQMTSQEIRLAIGKLQAEKDSITAKIDVARRLSYETGKHPDAKWLTSAEDGRRRRGREIAKLQAALSEAVLAEKALRTAANIKANDERSQEFARLRKDAERYRWLRSTDGTWMCTEGMPPDEIDAAIDAEMAAGAA